MTRLPSAFGLTFVATLAASALFAQPAAAQSVDELWERYETLATEYESLQQECDDGDRGTTYINRICREAAEKSLALADVIDTLIVEDTSLENDDRELLIDGMLTSRQIAGALWVELEECEEGKTILDELRLHPDIDSRPLVAQATATWQGRADACIAEQQAPLTATVEPANTTPALLVMSTGLGLLAGGVIWDLALGSQRSEFTDLRNDCDTPGVTGCDFTRLLELQSNLDGAKAPIGILYGVGAAAAVGGAIWLAVAKSSGGSDVAREVRLSPSFGAGFTGAQLDWRF